MANGPVIQAAVEGIVDEAVIRRLIAHVGGTAGDVYGRQGKDQLRIRMNAYNRAARRAPWVVLIDLDHDDDCAPPLRSVWVNQPAPHLCFRIAVREVEAWLLADREQFAGFLGVSLSRIPLEPETLEDPKSHIVRVAQTSRRRNIREDIVPRPGSGRRVGPAYASQMIEFASAYWRPAVAAARADSLRRAIECLKRLKQR